MTGGARAPVRVWFQKHTVEGRLPLLDDAYREHFAAVARPGTEVVVRTLPEAAYDSPIPAGFVRYGAVEAFFAAHFVAAAWHAEQQGFDAFIVGASQDPGLVEARAVTGIPVLGYGETAFHLAAMTGRSIGVVGFIPELEEPLRENLERFGLSGRVRAFSYVDTPAEVMVQALRGEPGPFLAAFTEAADRVVARGAEVIIPGEGLPNEVLWAAGIRSHGGAAILDPDGMVVKAAELLVDLRRSGILGPSLNGYRSRRPPADVLAHLVEVFQPASWAEPPQPSPPTGR
ncbi:MAG: aspartate/glutamate racemase family protein [Actinomycetota bacterium]|nr:aspartate/glutamate racemase family protein [Actinomycetota bacterium]